MNIQTVFWDQGKIQPVQFSVSISGFSDLICPWESQSSPLSNLPLPASEQLN